jgi:phosphoglucomutase/phosphomannomutase
LASWGFTNISYVQEQASFDGNFPHAPKPNPEEKEALQKGIRLLIEKKADLLLATDPDADRIAAVILHKGNPVILSGNEIGCCLLYHIASSLKETNRTPLHPAVIKTIVTSELFKAIAGGFQMSCFDVLTGFKYISALIEQWDQTKAYSFVFGAEESNGYLANTFVLDKDAISTGCLIAEMALKAKCDEKTLLDLLHQLYQEYGIYQEGVFSVSYPEGKEGMKQMEEVMERLRRKTPTLFGNSELLLLEDYQQSTALDLISKKTISLALPKSNVLRLWLDDNSKIVIRPSGTEPKIKIYAGVVDKNFSKAKDQIPLCKERVTALLNAVKNLLS